MPVDNCFDSQCPCISKYLQLVSHWLELSQSSLIGSAILLRCHIRGHARTYIAYPNPTSRRLQSPTKLLKPAQNAQVMGCCRLRRSLACCSLAAGGMQPRWHSSATQSGKCVRFGQLQSWSISGGPLVRTDPSLWQAQLQCCAVCRSTTDAQGRVTPRGYPHVRRVSAVTRTPAYLAVKNTHTPCSCMCGGTTSTRPLGSRSTTRTRSRRSARRPRCATRLESRCSPACDMRRLTPRHALGRLAISMLRSQKDGRNRCQARRVVAAGRWRNLGRTLLALRCQVLCQCSGSLTVAQEVYHGILVTSDFLSAAERDVLRWGGNAKTATPDRSGNCSCWHCVRTCLLCLPPSRQ